MIICTINDFTRYFCFTFTLGVLITLSSCGKKGCTNEHAMNYSDDAKNDDGSCHFQCCVAFWNTSLTSDYLDTTDAMYLDYYVDGEFISRVERILGSFPSSYNEVGCEGYSGLFPTKCIDLGTEQTKTLPYEVKDQNGNIMTSGIVPASGGYCVSIEITY